MRISKYGFISKVNSLPSTHEFSVEGEHRALRFNVDVKNNLAIMFLIWDSKEHLRVQHLSGIANKTILLGQKNENSSIGTHPGEIVPGIWRIEVFYYSSHEDDEGIGTDKHVEYCIDISDDFSIEDNEILELGEDSWVNYDDEDKVLTLSNYNWKEIRKSEERWYKGDFHTHTRLSDGLMTNYMAMDQAKKTNLDFFLTTEHNILSTGWPKGDILVVPGIEITTSKGHFNIFGIKEYIDIRGIIREREIFHQESIDMIMKEARKMDALCSINHSMMEPWDWQFHDTDLEHIDTLEICCDPTYDISPEANDMSIKLFDILWNDGHRIWGVGGSDSHLLPNETYKNSTQPSIIGDPGTYVLSKNLNANSILEAVKSGKIYISRGLSLDFNITQGDEIYYPGSKIVCENNCNNALIKYEIEIKNLMKDYKILFIENGKVVEHRKVNESKKYVFERIWDLNRYNWARLEIRDNEDNFIAFVNPIYSGKKESKLKMWKDLLKKNGGRE